LIRDTFAFFVPFSGDSETAIPFFILQHHSLALENEDDDDKGKNLSTGPKNRPEFDSGVSTVIS